MFPLRFCMCGEVLICPSCLGAGLAEEGESEAGSLFCWTVLLSTVHSTRATEAAALVLAEVYTHMFRCPRRLDGNETVLLLYNWEQLEDTGLCALLPGSRTQMGRHKWRETPRHANRVELGNDEGLEKPYLHVCIDVCVCVCVYGYTPRHMCGSES